VSSGTRGRTPVPATSAEFSGGRERGSSWAAGRSRRERSAKSARKGRWTRKEGLRPLVDRLRKGARVARERVEGVGHLREQLRLLARHRRGLARRAAEPLEEARQLGVRVAEVLHHRLEVAQERVEGGDRLVERGATARQRVSEALEAYARRFARLGVEGGQHVLEVLGLLGVRHPAGQSERAAGLDRLGGDPGRQLHVLEAQRRAGPYREAGVHGQRLHRLVELEVEDRDRAVALALGGDPVYHPDAEAAEAHLVATHQLGGVGHLGLEVVGGHEGKPGVGVVGDEHGDHRDQHRDRPHEHGAGHYRGSGAPSAHGARR
jgi:hypothetical protein